MLKFIEKTYSTIYADNGLFQKGDNRGQILLFVVIATLVALTVGLSIASRTVTNIKLSKHNEESQRAFQAAEAGLQQALKQQIATAVGSPVELSLPNQSNFSYTISDISGVSMILNEAQDIIQTKGIDVLLSAYSASYPYYVNPKYNGNITIYWGEDGNDCSNSALEMIILYGDILNPQMIKKFYDPCDPRRVSNTSPDPSVSDPSTATYNKVGYQFHVRSVISSITDGLLMKIIPVYKSTKVYVEGSADLPAQGKKIESTGKSGDTVRKIEYFQSFPQIPAEIFQYSMISQG